MSSFDCLPTELFSCILNQINTTKDLHHCSLVNQQFHRETNPLLWQQLLINKKETLDLMIAAFTTQPSSSSLLGEYIQTLSITFEISTTDFIDFIQYTPRLEHLKLHHASGLTNVNECFHHIPNLISLYTHYAHITSSFVQDLGQHCHQLAIIQLEANLYMDMDIFAPLQDCPITTISLSGYSQHVMASGFAHNMALSALTYFDLTSLNIYDFRNDYTEFLNTMIQHPHKWSGLTQFCIGGCDHMNDDIAIAFLELYPTIEVLELDRCNITDRTLDAISQWLPNIKQVKVDGNMGLTLDGLHRLVQQSPTIQEDVHCSLCDIYFSEDEYDLHINQELYHVYSQMEGYELAALRPKAFRQNKDIT